MSKQVRITGCIPARYASTRLPGKPLCEIAGKPMIVHVAERARQVSALDEVVVLTDDQRIVDAVAAAGLKAVMTSDTCASGTDRIAEYMQQSDSDIFVNMQGDEVTLNPAHIELLINTFLDQPDPQMGTLAYRTSDPEEINIPSCVKVVTSVNGNALYFSRNVIPSTQTGAPADSALIHVGVYIYTRETLQRLMQLEQTPLEKTEKLEQLRALENEITINVTLVDDYQGVAVDTPEDLEKARALLG